MAPSPIESRRDLAGVSRDLAISVVAGLVLLLFALRTHAAEPLPSWNDTGPKQAVLAFVDKVTREGGSDFVPVDQRIAVFDMDGTLIPEKPLPAAVMPIVEDVKTAATKNPALKQKPAIAALLEGDAAGVAAAGEAGLVDIISAATDGRTTEEVGASTRKVLETVKDPRYGKPYTELAYQPMVELVNHLHENGFQVWICSGSPVLFTRQFPRSTFGIPPQQILGSSVHTQFVERDGRTVLVYTNKIDHINDKEGKPVTINLAIGQRPLFVGGNVGNGGDIAMMRYSKDRAGPSFQLLINHDDAAREFAYAEKDGYSLDAAKKYGFNVVSIAKDWATIFRDPSSPSP